MNYHSHYSKLVSLDLRPSCSTCCFLKASLTAILQFEPFDELRLCLVFVSVFLFPFPISFGFGIVFEEGIPLPILVMEFLPTDLRRCLDVLPDEISYSILHNVSLCLAYLHSRTPVIVHLDIASINIILSANMTAKICDFGSAMLLERKYQMAQIPGHQAYMPPETMVDDPTMMQVWMCSRLEY